MGVFVPALIPIMMLIFLGYLLKHSNFLPEQTWVGIEKLTYFVLFPALLIKTLAEQSLVGSPWPFMLFVVTGTLLMVTSALVFIQKMFPQNGATFTSVFQGGVRFNTYITLAVAHSFFGATGLALASVGASFMIVLINVLCISVFGIWGERPIKGYKSFFQEIIGNPLIMSCVVGWFLSLSGVGLPYITGDIFEIVGRAALPLGLLSVGSALKLGVIPGHFSSIAVSSIAQFVIKPLITAGFIHYTGLTGAAAGVLVIAFMTPTAPSAYILARQLGGDTETMASIITVQTLLAFFAMPLIGSILFRWFIH